MNATLPVSLTMVRALRDYGELTGHAVGFKPAGGLRTAKDAMNWMILMKEEAGRRWLEPDLFRIGASSLLADIERQLEHHVTAVTPRSPTTQLPEDLPCPAFPTFSTAWTTAPRRSRTTM